MELLREYVMKVQTLLFWVQEKYKVSYFTIITQSRQR
jgi:hypothetical protein